MIKFYENKQNHTMFGKNQTKESLALISKPGKLNPMLGRNHNVITRALLSVFKK